MNDPAVDLLMLRHALEMSWQPETAYLEVFQEGNPALGQCYPTSRVVQHFVPEAEIVEGQVRTGPGPEDIEKHFWNVVRVEGRDHHIDWTWQQFPHGTFIVDWKIRDRTTLNDGERTIRRVELLLSRVREQLKSMDPEIARSAASL